MSNPKLLREAYEYCDIAQKLLNEAEQLVNKANNTENQLQKKLLLSQAKQNYVDVQKLMSKAYSLESKYIGTNQIDKANSRKQFLSNYKLNFIQNNNN